MAGYHTVGAGKVFHGVFDYGQAGRTGAAKAEWREIENRNFLWDAFDANASDPLPDNRPLNRLFDFSDFSAVPAAYHLFDWGALPEDRIDQMPDAGVSNAIQGFLRGLSREPFFCAAGFYKPHLPWHVPSRFFDLYDANSVTLPFVKADDLDDVPQIARQWALSPPDHEIVTGHGEWRNAVRAYLASVSYCDYLIGEVVAALDKAKLADSTIIVFLSDNGFHLGEKLHWRKFVLWEEATRVPLIIVRPGERDRNQSVDVPVSLVDLYPTLLTLCGIKLETTTDGVDLSKLLVGEGADSQRSAISTWGKGNHSVRTREWRFTRYYDGSEELYDHRTDPHEWHNLALVNGHDRIRDRLRSLLPKENE